MKNILIIGGTKGIGKSIVDNLVDDNNITCLSRNKLDFQHQNFGVYCKVLSKGKVKLGDSVCKIN